MFCPEEENIPTVENSSNEQSSAAMSPNYRIVLEALLAKRHVGVRRVAP
ncbi:MAG TPA: hypothetical protein VNA21_05575 [Steroidobacteraceae bacterium]|nr:hypothetical protein [Steroidobacteraceae bacterium]